VIAFFWICALISVVSMTLAALAFARRLSVLAAAIGQLAEHPLFATLRSAEASGAQMGHAAQNLTDAMRKLGEAFRTIGESLGAVAAYAGFVSAIAKSIEDLLDVFVPTLRGPTQEI